MKTTSVRFVIVSVLMLLLGNVSVKAVIVDNTSSGFSASSNWATGQAPDQYGTNFRYRFTAAVNDPATWTANLTSTGAYAVYGWWPARQFNSTAAPYIVYHSSGSTTIYVNQQLNGGRWNYFGTWTMGTTGGVVKLSCWASTGFTVSADAIMWK